MLRNGRVSLCTALAALLLAITVSPRTMSAKPSKTVTATMRISNATSLAGIALKPGNYKITANGSTVTMRLDNKVVAQAPARWKEGDNKTEYSFIITNEHGIKEIHFDGRSSYVEVAD